MSIVEENVKENPVFVVNGADWSAKVVVDGINVIEVVDKEGNSHPLFTLETQMMEAATRAIEIFYGIKIHHKKTGEVEPINPHGIDIVPIGDNQEITIGPMLHVCPLNGDPEKDYLLIPTHIILQNAGFVKQSLAMEPIWLEKMKEFEEVNKIIKEKLDKDIKKFEELQNSPAPAKPKRKYTKKKKK